MEANLEELKMQVANLIARVAMAEAQIAEMDDDIPEPDLRNSEGGADSPGYASYFKLIDATVTPGTPRLAVIDGGNVSSGLCGAGYVNGQLVDVTKYYEAVTESGAAWLLIWITALDGEMAEVVLTTGARPANIHGGLYYKSILLGRFTVDYVNEMQAITAITQDYPGGQFDATLWGDCLGKAIPEE